MGSLDWTAAGSIATALAVLVAAWQLHRGTAQARIDFEDALSRPPLAGPRLARYTPATLDARWAAGGPGGAGPENMLRTAYVLWPSLFTV